MTTSVIPKSNVLMDEPVDIEISQYLNLKSPQSFFLFAGAGSGKTRSLVNALHHIRDNYDQELALRGHGVGIITYTNAACDEIKRRVDFHPLFHVSTIHSFAWEMIRGFNHDIREWLKIKLAADIQELQEDEAKGRTGTKASITRQAKIESKTKRLETLDAIWSFSYNPNGENKERNSLNHSEVIEICSTFLSQKPQMQWILVGRFPFLLIDESQDTNRHLIDALFIVVQKHSERFSLGLFGDTMQRIYADGKERIEDELPKEWGKPSKKLNHRCPKRVVQLINKIREEVDTHTQSPRTDAPDGHVRLFIRSATVEDRQGVEDGVCHKMAEITDDKGWENQESCKILTLEHHMAAKRLGFKNVFTPLYAIDSWRTGLLDGPLASMRFFTESILPLIEAAQSNDKFSISRIVRKNSPLLTSNSLEKALDPGDLLRCAQAGVEELMTLWHNNSPNCGDILRCVDKHKLFNIPDILLPVVKVLSADNSLEQDELDDPINDEMTALLSLMQAPFSEIDVYRRYVSGLASFDTHQGVKGLEFERVMVIMDDSEARGFMFGYGKLLGDKEPSAADIKNIQEGKDSSIDRTRRLLYVTCSRAERSLALVAYSANPNAIKLHVIRNGWFTENEVDVV